MSSACGFTWAAVIGSGSAWTRLIVVAALIGLVAFAPSLKRLEARHFWGFVVLLVAVIGFVVAVFTAGSYIGNLVGPTLRDLELSSSP